MLKMLKKRTWLLVVLITALLSCLAVGITSAKYYSEISGTSTMQTASFNVTAEFKDTVTDITLEEGESTYFKELEFDVTNSSDVSVSYDVVMTITSDLPESVVFTVDGNEKISVSNNQYTFTGGTINITDENKTKTHVLMIAAEDFSSDLQITGISVAVVVTQVEPN